jgi:hypothetical protein
MKKKYLQKNREYYNIVINLREKCSSVFIDMLEQDLKILLSGNMRLEMHYKLYSTK